MNENNQIIIYQTEDGQTRVDVRMENDTVWLTTSQMAMLFEREESNIRRHVINVFKEGELEKENNVHFLHVNGVKKPVPFYNLDVIISVGYRVKSQRGVKFRQWANKILKEYLVKGYAVNDRLRRDQLGDGNKRIAATLFLWFLNNNGILYRSDGSKRIADNTLVALTLMIAESRTEEKDVMVKVVVNLINQRNE